MTLRLWSQPRVSALVALALAAAFLGSAPAPAEAATDSGMESQFVSLLNQARANKGLPKLPVAGDLVGVARNHSKVMADKNKLHHNPSLGSHVTNWSVVGENVGTSSSGVQAIHNAFMNSAGHKANILDCRWVEVGVGVEVRDGKVWVTQVYRLPKGVSNPCDAKKKSDKKADEPAPKPSSAPEKSSGSSGGSKPAAPPEPEPEPEPEVEQRPLPLDVVKLKLARLEAMEQGHEIEDMLGG